MKKGLVGKLEEMLRDSDVATSDVGEQRERNHRYYALEPLGNEQKGRSHYIDPAVLSSVESKKALFSETFLSSREVVEFSPGRGTQDEADAKGAYVKKVFKDNQYERLFRDAWHDAFVAKRCTVWLSWERDTEVVELQFTGALSQVVNQQVQMQGNVVNVDTSELESFPIPSIGQPQFVHSGVVRVEIDASKVKLDLIAPEKVYRDPNADYTDTSLWNIQEIEVSKGMLIDAGYDPDQVNKLTHDYTYSSREEDYARKAHDQSYTSDYQKGATNEQTIVTTYKARVWLALDEDSVDGFTPKTSDMRLYEVCWGGNEILRYEDGTPHIEEIDAMDVYEWSEMKIAHAENGLCTADVEAASQKNLSLLKRGIIDNMHMVNNTRYEAVHDRLFNPRDLLDNVIGGVVFSEAIGSVATLAQPPLSPLTLPAIEMISRDSEERSGVSSLAKGMNSDVIKNQNADSMVERLTNAGTRRVMAAARDFAKTFLVPLMQGIVTLGMKHDQTQDQMESGGRIVPIIPQQWQDDIHDMDIAVALTPDEAQSMAQKMILMHNLKSQDPAIGAMYGPEQRHAFYDSVYELMGVKDSTPYLLPPESPEYQQAMQQNAQQAQQAQMMAQQQQQFQMMMMQREQQRRDDELANKILDTTHDNELDDEKFQWDRYTDQAEIQIERSQDRQASIG